MSGDLQKQQLIKKGGSSKKKMMKLMYQKGNLSHRELKSLMLIFLPKKHTDRN